MSEQYFEEEEFDTQFNGADGAAHPQAGAAALAACCLVSWPAIGIVALNDAIFTYLSKLIIDDAILPGQDRPGSGGAPHLLRRVDRRAVGWRLCFHLPAGILGERIRYDLRKKMFNHLQELSFSYFDRTPVGWIMSRVTSDTERIAELVTWGLLDVTWGMMSVARLDGLHVLPSTGGWR